MALNKNHEFEELDGVKCGIVEKNVKPERLSFLKDLLENNGYAVVAVPIPPPKVAAPPKPVEDTAGAEPKPLTPSPTPETFTVGVTDYTFNPINAIFGRILKTKDGGIVTLAYWNQEEKINDDATPYFDKKETWK
jgi:hypothetical protein